MAIAELTQVCNSCGLEKPIGKFGLRKSKRTDIRYRLHTCGVCRDKKWRDKNRDHHGYAVSLHEMGRREKQRLENIKLYGFATDPIVRERAKEWSANRSAINMVLYGQTRDSGSREKANKHKEVLRNNNKALYGITRTPEGRARDISRNNSRRLQAIELYGSKCECCGEERIGLLTFDHINGYKKGEKDRVGIQLVNSALREYATSGYPNSKYRLLCWDCNIAISRYGCCPHKPSPIKPTKDAGFVTARQVIKRRYTEKLKKETISAYGGKCALCGETIQEFLSIDHINKDGAQHRRSLGSIGKHTTSFRSYLRRLGWPKDNYRLLCMNCNSGLYFAELRNKTLEGAVYS